MRAYLAGPEVFLPNAREILDRKIALARHYGFTPVSPGDLAVPETETRGQRGLAISAINEKLMTSADLIIANLTPFRGVAADVGTAFELGFMCARGCPAFAFSNCTDNHFERVSKLYGGVTARGGVIVTRQVPQDQLFLDLAAFEECLTLAAKKLLKQAASA
ncbi:nucleoside 2-deoxyribosyltransferase [Rhizobium sp. WW_1]|uniref:nucleoside 2-deoxyribosyltransferase n=1 Tax=Rhizobium sp. WW_1 TaxID=1907375 RepID=UPI000645AC63|nr:nucleoside 2-deoxyribosyltransferase [Rhizobium sp. WW_1]RKD52667.1 nucleoside 2-deoxyribosyltransferase-like protein [Rhizobium sp. WW_1]